MNSLFKDVAMLVEEQGIVLNEVEGHADVAAEETTKANVELNQAETY